MMKLTFMFTFVGGSSAIAISSTAAGASNATAAEPATSLKELKVQFIQAVKEDDVDKVLKMLHAIDKERYRDWSHTKPDVCRAQHDQAGERSHPRHHCQKGCLEWP